MRPCCYAFSGVACTMSPYGAFKEKPPALPGDVYYYIVNAKTIVSSIFFILFQSSSING